MREPQSDSRDVKLKQEPEFTTTIGSWTVLKIQSDINKLAESVYRTVKLIKQTLLPKYIIGYFELKCKSLC